MADDRNRTSVTVRPSTAELLDEMIAASGLSKQDIFTIGVDTLHFVWSVLKIGGTIAVKTPGSRHYAPVQIVMPGLITSNGAVGDKGFPVGGTGITGPQDTAQSPESA